MSLFFFLEFPQKASAQKADRPTDSWKGKGDLSPRERRVSSTAVLPACLFASSRICEQLEICVEKRKNITVERKTAIASDLLHALLWLAGHAGLGHVALEDALLDVLRVVLLALLGVQAAEEDTLQVLVGFGAEEEHDGDDEDDTPFPRMMLADVQCKKLGRCDLP